MQVGGSAEELSIRYLAVKLEKEISLFLGSDLETAFLFAAFFLFSLSYKQGGNFEHFLGRVQSSSNVCSVFREKIIKSSATG